VPLSSVPHWFILGFFAAGACLRAAEPADSTAAQATAVLSAAASAAVAHSPSAEVENAVVKVFATTRNPEPYQPWAKAAPHDVSGTGVVIDGRRILTNAHVVMYASQIQVQGYRSGDKLSARVEAVSPGIDLAILKLNDEAFFDTHVPIKRASILPSVKDPVLVYGFPAGGTSLSITKGIVSRIEFSGYNYPMAGLRIQIDAAINPGNSGGPAVAGDAMVGLAFSHLGGAENIGYIIPCEEIELFLKGIAGGQKYRKPGLHDDLQSLQNPALRAFLQAGPAIKGMVVTHPQTAETGYPLKQWDIITQIGTVPIEDDGNVLITDTLRVSFRYLVQKLAKDGRVPVKIFRAGKLLDIQVPVPGERPMLISDLQGAYPSYFVFGPMVFSAATTQFFSGIGNNAAALSALGAMGNPLITRRGDQPAFPGEQLVVVSSPYFPHDLAKGYDNATASVVQSVNGITIKNLKHLVEVFRDSQDEFLRIQFVGRNHEDLVFRRKELVAATDEILSDNGVRSQGSPDLMKVWSGATPAGIPAKSQFPAAK
jgi:S1-C subfamily serine protease